MKTVNKMSLAEFKRELKAQLREMDEEAAIMIKEKKAIDEIFSRL